MNIGIINSSQNNVVASPGIAVDATSVGVNTTGTSATYAHTCSGNNRILFVALYVGSTTNLVTGVTYAGVSMTLVNSANVGAGSTRYLYSLIAPATGANNVVILTSASTIIRACSVSYTGVSQTGQPDAQSIINEFGTIDLNSSVTTQSDKSWVIMYAYGTDQAIISGCTLRASATGVTSIKIYDSGAAITPAGIKTFVVHFGEWTYTSIMASFSPAN